MVLKRIMLAGHYRVALVAVVFSKICPHILNKGSGKLRRKIERFADHHRKKDPALARSNGAEVTLLSSIVELTRLIVARSETRVIGYVQF